MVAPWKKSYDQPRQHIKKQRHYFTNKGPLVKAMVFPVVIYEYESWIINKTKWWCFWNVVLEKTLESPLDNKEIKPFNPKGNQPWIFIGKTDVEAETPILWPPDVKSQLIGKDPDVGKDRWQEEKGVTEGEMVGLHHRFNGHEFEQTPGDSEGQGSLAWCSPWGHKKSNTIDRTTSTTTKTTRKFQKNVCILYEKCRKDFFF